MAEVQEDAPPPTATALADASALAAPSAPAAPPADAPPPTAAALAGSSAPDTLSASAAPSAPAEPVVAAEKADAAPSEPTAARPPAEPPVAAETDDACPQPAKRARTEASEAGLAPAAPAEYVVAAETADAAPSEPTAPPPPAEPSVAAETDDACPQPAKSAWTEVSEGGPAPAAPAESMVAAETADAAPSEPTAPPPPAEPSVAAETDDACPQPAKRARTEASEGGPAGSGTFSQIEGAGWVESGASGETQPASLSREVERLKLLVTEREAAHKKEVKALKERMQREVRYRDEALQRMLQAHGASMTMDQQQQMQQFHAQAQPQAASGGKKGKNATPALPPHLMHPSFGTPPAMQYPLVSYQTTATGQPAQPPAPSLSGGPSYGGARLAHTVTEDEARFLQETLNPNPRTQNLSPSHLNPEPETLHHKLRNSQSESPNSNILDTYPKPQTRNPQPEAPNHTPPAPHHKLGNRNHQHQTSNANP